tara:strand:+ start:1139 stop:1498 length:360 start_codon:yes stop_codon:yes gene_type:complete
MKRLSIIIAMIVALWANATNAGHKGDTLETYNMFWSQLPVICGNTMDVAVYLEEHDFKLESVSTGRAGASAEGEPVFMVSYFVKEDKTESIPVVTALPKGDESCMLYRSFDLTLQGQNL